jgi:hypothetical protein
MLSHDADGLTRTRPLIRAGDNFQCADCPGFLLRSSKPLQRNGFPPVTAIVAPDT